MRRTLAVIIASILIVGWSAYAQLRGPASQESGTSGDSAGVVRRVDVNRASLDELCRLPGITRVVGEKIVAHRPYKRLDDLVAKRILGKKQFALVREYINVGPSR
jgi:DNA uptake protein ComE-like DNA-binding protein